MAYPDSRPSYQRIAFIRCLAVILFTLLTCVQMVVMRHLLSWYGSSWPSGRQLVASAPSLHLRSDYRLTRATLTFPGLVKKTERSPSMHFSSGAGVWFLRRSGHYRFSPRLSTHQPT